MSTPAPQARLAATRIASSIAITVWAIRSDAASIILPSNEAAPRPAASALRSSSTMRRAHATSASGGLNTSLASSTWLGWIAHLPSHPRAAARRIVEELRKAEAAGLGAAALDGKMIDAASERMAQTVIAMDDAIRAAASRA